MKSYAKPNDPEGFEVAISIIIEMSELVNEMLKGEVLTKQKPDNTPVTNIDTTVNDRTIQRIRNVYPDAFIYGEEQSVGARASKVGCWVLDPIDGTQALGQGINTFTIDLAKVGSDGMPLFSVAASPPSGEVFTATADRAEVNGSPLNVSETSDFKGSYVYLGSRINIDGVRSNGQIYDDLENLGAKVVNVRSLAFSGMQVARGKAISAVLGVKTPFEAATLKLMVEGAGGIVTDLHGNQPQRYDDVIEGLLVSNNKTVHEKMLETLTA